MNFGRVAALVALVWLVAFAPGCKKDPDQAEGPRDPAFFAEIPADTFYFVGGAEPVPTRLVGSALEFLDTARTFSDDLGEPVAETLEPGAPAQDLDFAQFLADRMGGEITPEGLDAIGIERQPRLALYGFPLHPVFRIELSDKAAFRGFIEEWASAYDVDLRKSKSGGEEHYVSAQGDSTLLVRVTEDEAIFAVMEADSVEAFLPYLLGQKKPQVSMADTNVVRQVAERHGFRPFGVAYFDAHRLAEFAAGQAKLDEASAAVLAGWDALEDLSPECQADVLRLTAQVPRLVGGVRQYDDELLEVAGGVELAPQTARKLREAVRPAPAHDTEVARRALLEIGMGIDVGKFLDLAGSTARAINQQPFECGDMRDFNQQAQQVAMSVGFAPPAVREISGLSLIVRAIGMDWRAGAAGQDGELVYLPKVLAILRSKSPTDLLYLASQAMPELQQLSLKPDAKPVALPMLEGQYPGIVEPIIVMTENGLGVSVGPAMQTALGEAVDAVESETAPVFVMRANLGEPVAEMVADLDRIVEAAAKDKQARGLSDADIADARAVVDKLERLLPNLRREMAIQVHVNDFGALLSYRDVGPSLWDIDWDEQFDDAAEQQLEALEKILGMTDEFEDELQGEPVYETQTLPPSGAEPVEIRRSPPGGMGTRGTSTTEPAAE